MPYRDDAGEALVARTSEGALRATLAGSDVELTVDDHKLAIARREVAIVAGNKTERLRLAGALVLARGVPREDLGVWLEVEDNGVLAMRRVFGVVPVSVLEPHGLDALGELDRLSQRVRGAVGELAGDIVRATEIGAGHPLDKVLVTDRGARLDVYARRLFGGHARRVLEVKRDGHVALVGSVDTVTVPSRYAIRVRGDFLRFADVSGTDRLRLGIPWITPEDRDELVERIAKFVERDKPSPNG